MSKKKIEMKIIRKMLLLLQRGLSDRQIAKELRISRPSVGRYKDKLLKSGKSMDDLLGMDDSTLAEIAHVREQNKSQDSRSVFIENRKEYYLAELNRVGVTRLLLWQEYIRADCNGFGYSKFCELLAQQMLPQKASYHMTYEPGALMMVDFAGDKISYIDRPTGALVECPVFVCVLPYSGYSYTIALPDEKTPNVVKGLNGSVAYFGGVPLGVKCDNMRTAVVKSSKYEPAFTEVFEQWALHNNIALFAARPQKPKDKAMVEKEVLLTYQRLYAPLRDKEFFSLEEINAAFLVQMNLHHQMHFQNKTISRTEQFMQLEKEFLNPLPPTPFVIRHKIVATVKMNYHIMVTEDGNQYSVPYKYIGKKVVVNYDTDNVEIFYELERIALHKRSYRKGSYVTSVDHMPLNHQKIAEQKGWDSDYFLDLAAKTGPHTHEYISRLLKSRPVIQQAFDACKGIFRLGNKYGQQRLENASKRALQGDKYNYTTLDNILKNNLDKLLDEQEPDIFRIPDHPNIRGANAYE
jgi:transposase